MKFPDLEIIQSYRNKEIFGRQHLDIYIPKLNIAIEYQGKQHYEPSSKFGGAKGFYQQQFNDNKKRRFCALHDFKLIEIPYTDENLISYDYIMRKAGY